MNTSEVLNRAADKIERDGWTKGTAGMFVGGPHCALGALAAVTNSVLRPGMEVPTYDYLFDSAASVDACGARDALAAYLDRALMDPDFAVYEWNDRRESAAEVVEALRAAAIIAAAQETDVAVVAPLVEVSV